jgi:hypothetical protein
MSEYDDAPNPQEVWAKQHKINKASLLPQFEDELVEWLFVKHKIPGGVRRDIRERFAAGPEKLIPLNAWNEAFVDYPVLLCATIISRIDKACTVSKLAMDFEHLPILDKFHEARAELGAEELGKPTGLIFRWPNLIRRGEPTGCFVFTDNAFDPSCSGMRIIWPPDGQNTDCWFMMTPLIVFSQEMDGRERWKANYRRSF